MGQDFLEGRLLILFVPELHEYTNKKKYKDKLSKNLAASDRKKMEREMQKGNRACFISFYVQTLFLSQKCY